MAGMAKRQEDDPPLLTSTASLSRPHNRTRQPTRARLHVVHPPEIVEHIEVAPDTTLALGRTGGEGAHALRNDTVSRRHFELGWDKDLGAHTGRDLGSHNGSSVDGDQVSDAPRPLPDGALLRLGHVLLVYELASSLPVDPPQVSKDAMPGASAGMQRLRAQAARAAADSAPVLIRRRDRRRQGANRQRAASAERTQRPLRERQLRRAQPPAD
jgi:hypothetical protein